MIRHTAPAGISQRAWMAHLASKADELEEEIRYLNDTRRYADRRERDEIDEKIAKMEAILCQMHC